jgi:ribosomal protein S18 acetylase RimI-like enzyme
MFIRTASRRDLPAIRALLVETWHATYDAIYGPERVTEITNEWHSIKALGDRLELPNGEFLVADDGKAIHGVAFAATERDGKVVLLRQLYVRPGSQGKGIGGMLLQEIEGSFFDADTIRVEVAEANGQAVGFYRAEGFVEAGQAESPDPLISILSLEKPLL